MAFRKAERKKALLRLALTGPSGSGKTYSALKVAMGLTGDPDKIALIDTEAGSGELYADLLGQPYGYARLDPPFSPARYVEQIQEAEDGGFQVIIIDSLSHAWSGKGGILEIKDQASASSSSHNSFDAWRKVTPQHNALVDAILRSSAHIIVCVRTKTEWEITEDEKGKKKPIKIGLKPEQREGLEYEFTVVLDLSVEGHIATSSKDRTGLFDGQYRKLDEQAGRDLLGWLTSGVDPGAASLALLEDLRARALDCTTVDALNDLYRSTSGEAARLTPAHRDAFIEACGQVKKGLQKAGARRQPEEQAGLDFPGDAPAAAA